MSIDFDKPVRTRDGRPVRILAHGLALSGGESVAGVFEGRLFSWNSDGSYMGNGNRDGLDLVQVDPHAPTVYRKKDGLVVEIIENQDTGPTINAKQFRVHMVSSGLCNFLVRDHNTGEEFSGSFRPTDLRALAKGILELVGEE